MYAADYRAFARNVLKGKWKSAIAIFFLAGLVLNGFGVDIVLRRFSEVKVQALMLAGQEYRLSVGIPHGFGWFLYVLSLAVSLFGLLTLVGSYSVCRAMIGGGEADRRMMFPVRMLGKILLMNLMRAFLLVLGYLLLFVPGLILTFAYAMADYLIAENPEIGLVQALRESRRRMNGRKFNLFCLDFSFFGWMLLASFAVWLLTTILTGIFGNGYIASILILLTGTAVNACLDVYMSMAQAAFFMEVRQPFTEEYAADDAARNADADPDIGTDSADARNADDAEAQELYMQYRCSRRLIRAAGLEEDYDRLNPDPAAEARIRRDYADELIRRFDREPDALDDIISLVNEYQMDSLLDRALMRVDRHIRQATLSADRIMDMCGRALLAATSGAFAEREAYVQRKKDQIADMLDRLTALPDADAVPEDRLEMIRGMCR